jgi:hypothetical protein
MAVLQALLKTITSNDPNMAETLECAYKIRIRYFEGGQTHQQLEELLHCHTSWDMDLWRYSWLYSFRVLMQI